MNATPLTRFRRLLEAHGIYDEAIDLLRKHQKLKEVELGFKKLKNKLSHEKGIKNPAALAASIGRKKLGQAEMTKRSEAGRKK